MKRYDVLSAGILVADLFTAPMPNMLAPGELSRVDDITLECGGCAANVAIVLAKLGLSVALSGRVGDDFFGSAVIEQLKASRLETSNIRLSSAVPTSKTVIVIVKGEDRRYIHAVGANAEFNADDIDKSLIEESKVFYVGGLFAMDRLDCGRLAPLFRHAREAGTKTVLDVVVPAGFSLKGTGLAELLPYTDLFLPNEDEAGLLSGITEPADQARFFQRMGAGCVVITRGGKGSLAISADEALCADAFAVDVVDASGGGDAFASGFIYGELQGWTLRRKLEFASAMGASACRKRGCTAGTFTLLEAERFVKDHRLTWSDVSLPL